MKRIVEPASVLLLMATACYPPLPPERDRFLGIRRADHPRRPVVMFGRCGSEVVTQVQLRYADPPEEVPHGGVLWRIASSGSSGSRFVVDETPSGFREVIPLGDSKLPSQYLSIEVRTDDARCQPPLEWIDLFALTAWGTPKRFGRKIVLNAGRGDF
jgi:hypothetical protein